MKEREESPVRKFKSDKWVSYNLDLPVCSCDFLQTTKTRNINYFLNKQDWSVILHDTVLKHKKESESSALEINLTQVCCLKNKWMGYKSGHLGDLGTRKLKRIIISALKEWDQNRRDAVPLDGYTPVIHLQKPARTGKKSFLLCCGSMVYALKLTNWTTWKFNCWWKQHRLWKISDDYTVN